MLVQHHRHHHLRLHLHHLLPEREESTIPVMLATVKRVLATILIHHLLVETNTTMAHQAHMDIMGPVGMQEVGRGQGKGQTHKHSFIQTQIQPNPIIQILQYLFKFQAPSSF